MSAADRLLGAVAGMWRSHGRAQMSARQVSQSAGAQASQINYYFGGFEQLLCSAQGRAIAHAAAWCERTLSEMGRIDATANGGEAFGHLLAAIIDDWCRSQADLAFAWGECQILAARQPDFADANAQWQALWKRFWDEACALTGMGPQADLVRVFFTGEAFLHRIVWRGSFDRACLSESGLSWARLLMTGDPGEGPLRDYARVETARFAAPVLVAGSVHERIAEAAADIVGREGAAAVTHRAVAQTAGLNLGAVTYHFPSAGDLMAAAWAYIYLRLTRPHLTADDAPVTRQSYIEGLTAYSAADARQPDALAMEALLSQAARDESLRDRGAMIRYSRGQTTLHRLSRLPREQGPLGPQAAGLVSTFAQGLGRDLSVLSPAQRPAEARRLITQLLDALQVR
ncbi:TetR family transcriptional regulator [Asticcacaulis sp. AND118]|uniref:TetR family transcriptional regulator n=1 Tax=Asticcacaulis sp. AND118 TaxID=2840468 RepID=UPI001CFF620A|nr:TetR family transcriptional regulator [Asticcacaulis sp. AND118]UDF05660.1 TetR family transcriptional regulator [Asticcacaulis sp. AND118]